MTSEVAKFMPSLCWVLRDFHLDLADEQGYEISSEEYLESSLAEVDPESASG